MKKLSCLFNINKNKKDLKLMKNQQTLPIRIIIMVNRVTAPKGLEGYQKISSKKTISANKKTAHYEETYEKKLSVIYRIAIGALALVATLTILPYCLKRDKVTSWWKQAITGIDQKIIHFDNPVKTNRIRFKEARARSFDKDQKPEDVGDTSSAIFKNLRTAAAG